MTDNAPVQAITEALSESPGTALYAWRLQWTVKIRKFVEEEIAELRARAEHYRR